MDSALTVRRLNETVGRSRRMFRRTLVSWASDYLTFQADHGHRCRWTGGARPAGDHHRGLADLIADPPAED